MGAWPCGHLAGPLASRGVRDAIACSSHILEGGMVIVLPGVRGSDGGADHRDSSVFSCTLCLASEVSKEGDGHSELWSSRGIRARTHTAELGAQASGPWGWAQVQPLTLLPARELLWQGVALAI